MKISRKRFFAPQGPPIAENNFFFSFWLPMQHLTPTRTPKSDYDSAGSYDRAIFCKDGFYGTNCQSVCPVNCAQPYCSASGFCMATSVRIAGSDYDSAGSYDRASFCKDGFSGSTCGTVPKTVPSLGAVRAGFVWLVL